MSEIWRWFKVSNFKKAVLKGFNPRTEVQVDYSPNNLRRLVITETGAVIMYHVSTNKTKGLFFVTRYESFDFKDLEVLLKPRVHSSLEEVWISGLPYYQEIVNFFIRNEKSFVRLKGVYYTDYYLEEIVNNLLKPYVKELAVFNSSLEQVFEGMDLQYTTLLSANKPSDSTFLRPQYYRIDGEVLGRYFERGIKLEEQKRKVLGVYTKEQERVNGILTKGREILRHYGFSGHYVESLEQIDGLSYGLKTILRKFDKKYYMYLLSDALRASGDFKVRDYKNFILQVNRLGLEFSDLDVIYKVVEETEEVAGEDYKKAIDVKGIDEKSFLKLCEFAGVCLLRVYLQMAIALVSEWGIEPIKVNNQIWYYRLKLVTNKRISNALGQTRFLDGEITKVSEGLLKDWQKICKIADIKEAKLGSQEIQDMIDSIEILILTGQVNRVGE